MGAYDTAQICVNGHLINDSAEGYPIHNSPHCPKCGAKTITHCPDCQAKIQGAYHAEGILSGLDELSVAPFCRACGKAFPWTASALESARFLADETDTLTTTEREQLKSTFDDLIGDTPRTTLAATRFKKFMLKAGKETARAFRDIFVDIASETAKKSIFGP